MSQNDNVLDQETYDRGIAALDQYLKRTSTRYAIVRLVCNLCFMPLVAFATDFQHRDCWSLPSHYHLQPLMIGDLSILRLAL